MSVHPDRVEVDETDLLPELQILHAYAKKHVVSGDLMTCFRLLQYIIKAQYEGSFQNFLSSFDHGVGVDKFNGNLTNTVLKWNWCEKTSKRRLFTIRKILSFTVIDENSLKRLSVRYPKEPYNRMLGKKYSKLPPDNKTRMRLEKWLDIIQDNTNNKSAKAVKSILTFFVRTVCPVLGLKIDNWETNTNQLVAAALHNNPDLFTTICGPRTSSNRSNKVRWLSLFLKHVVCSDVVIPQNVLKVVRHTKGPDDDDGTDVHRISAEHLDLLYEESKKHIRHELLFLLMVGSGLRIGGVANILINQISTYIDNKYVVNTYAKTREKGNKWGQFIVNEYVQKLIYEWLTQHRRADTNPYLFPGIGNSPLTTSTIRRIFSSMCKNLNLSGKQFHPHALRHTFAHLALESGLRVEIVSKLLNHASSVVTQSYYLRENIEEVHVRMGENTPAWLKGVQTNKKTQQPAFLATINKDCEKVKREAIKQKKAKKLALYGSKLLSIIQTQ